MMSDSSMMFPQARNTPTTRVRERQAKSNPETFTNNVAHSPWFLHMFSSTVTSQAAAFG